MIKNIKWILDANLLRSKPMPDVRYKNNIQTVVSWCDALFMAPPTFGMQITKDVKYLDYAITIG